MADTPSIAAVSTASPTSRHAIRLRLRPALLPMRTRYVPAHRCRERRSQMTASRDVTLRLRTTGPRVRLPWAAVLAGHEGNPNAWRYGRTAWSAIAQVLSP